MPHFLKESYRANSLVPQKEYLMAEGMPEVIACFIAFNFQFRNQKPHGYNGSEQKYSVLSIQYSAKVRTYDRKLKTDD
jgi:hypothetical protein